MTTTISRLYDSYDAASRAVKDLEAAGQGTALPINMVRTQQEVQASDQWPYHVSAPLVQIEKIGESAPALAARPAAPSA